MTLSESPPVSEFFRENTGDADLGKRSLRGGAVGIVSRALNNVVSIGSVLILARLLSPEDYGLVGMVTAFTGYTMMLVSLGTPDIVIQRQSITEGEVSALFWLSLGIGTVSAVLLGVCSPLISRFYGEPRLTMIVLVDAIPFVLTALHCQHSALLRRAMRFPEVCAIELAANVVSAGVAVTMAFCGFAYWALALRPVTMNAFLAAGVWMRCRWLPPRPTITADVKKMVKLGLNITGFTLLDYVGRSADRVAIGYRNGARALGYYQNALSLYENVLDVLVAPLHTVAVAGLSKVTADLEEFRRLWGKALGALLFYAMPAFGLLAVISRDVVVLLLGAKWASAGALLSILALRGIPHSVERTAGWLHVTAGRTDRWVRWGVVATCVQLAALACGLPFGPRGVVTAYVASTFVVFVPAIAYAGRPLGIRTSDVVRVSWRPLTGSVAAVAIGFMLRYTVFPNGSAPLRIAALSLAYIAAYLVIVVGLFRLRAPIGVMLALVRDILPLRIARLARMPGSIDPFRKN